MEFLVDEISSHLQLCFNQKTHTMKFFVAAAFLMIFISLGSALIYLMKDKGKSNRTVRALAFRVGFSICLFIAILLANHFGYIHPTGIR